jgi:hypothetical protein
MPIIAYPERPAILIPWLARALLLDATESADLSADLGVLLSAAFDRT